MISERLSGFFKSVHSFCPCRHQAQTEEAMVYTNKIKSQKCDRTFILAMITRSNRARRSVATNNHSPQHGHASIPLQSPRVTRTYARRDRLARPPQTSVMLELLEWSSLTPSPESVNPTPVSAHDSLASTVSTDSGSLPTPAEFVKYITGSSRSKRTIITEGDQEKNTVGHPDVQTAVPVGRHSYPQIFPLIIRLPESEAASGGESLP